MSLIAGISPGIRFNTDDQRFTLQGHEMTYVIRVHAGELLHEYWGAPLASCGPAAPWPRAEGSGWQHALSRVPREFPDARRGDSRIAALQLCGHSGDTTVNLRYIDHTITPGKPPLPGLPSCFAAGDDRVQTLQIRLHDEVLGLWATLHYSLFPHFNAVCRRVEMYNESNFPVTLQKVASFSFDLPRGDYDMLQLSGAWARERFEVRRRVCPGDLGIGSSQGFSGHEHNPFIAVLDADTTETHGQVRALSLVYSGSFVGQVQQSPQGLVRTLMALGDSQFSWCLRPQCTFYTPECVGLFAGRGLAGMSHSFHGLYRQHLMRSLSMCPPLFNSWEAAYFDVNAEVMKIFAPIASAMGLKVMVLDDGWFGNQFPRDTDMTSLGDWEVNLSKFPQGLKGLADDMNAAGLQLGLWIEPEMVSPFSELGMQHPDWCLKSIQHVPSEQRNQLMLDLSRSDVQNHLIQVVSALLEQAPIVYVKWDANRCMHEVGSALQEAACQPEVGHLYMLGLYHVIDILTTKYPGVWFLNCASGGGRFDPGMLHYMPQGWLSDCTDAATRLSIQMHTSYVYPASAMAGHVTAVPNQQTLRTTSLKFRTHVAMMNGSFGYEMDLRLLALPERMFAARCVMTYSAIQPLIHSGTMHRLRHPDRDNWPAVMFVETEGASAVLFAFQKAAQPAQTPPYLHLRGLQHGSSYRFDAVDCPELHGTSMSGATLMEQGLLLAFHGDWDSCLLRLTRADVY